MAFPSLFTLLDDVTSILDDVAAMTKITAKKTAGVLSDDLALNANQVTGVKAERELAVVWAVAKGSFINKLILVPFALLIAYFFPVIIPYLLVLGGLYLCFEGIEKIIEKIQHIYHKKIPINESEPEANILSEQEKIKGAIRTDFILSAEIITIALGVVSQSSLVIQALVLSMVAISITFFVYGLVALIVKLDDIGLWLLHRKSAVAQVVGKGIIFTMPYFMRLLSIVGVTAMFLVGGGIIAHNIPFIHHFLESRYWLEGIFAVLANLVIGLLSGSILVGLFEIYHHLRSSHKH